MRRTEARKELGKDLMYILIGLLLAAALSRTGILDSVIDMLGDTIITSFIAGIFFTSAFTIAPATVALIHIAGGVSIHVIAFWGALGAVCGDMILFFFIRDKFADDLKRSFKPSFVHHVMNSFHFGFLKWLSPVIGALIIASPLPDELGIAMLGMSKVRLVVLIPVAFVMNMIGIYFILWFAKLIR